MASTSSAVEETVPFSSTVCTLGARGSYLTDGSDPQIQVIAYRPQDDTMNYSIQIYRSFGYKKDSFHSLGEDGETYTWDSFKKAMSAGYNAQKKLKMKQK